MDAHHSITFIIKDREPVSPFLLVHWLVDQTKENQLHSCSLYAVEDLASGSDVVLSMEEDRTVQLQPGMSNFRRESPRLRHAFREVILSFSFTDFLKKFNFLVHTHSFRALWNHNALHLKKSSALLIAEWLRHPVYHSGWTANFSLAVCTIYVRSTRSSLHLSNTF